jgi:hypothetical protein
MFFVLAVYLGVISTFLFIRQQEKGKSLDTDFSKIVASDIVKSIDKDTNIDVLSNQIKVIFSSYDRKSKGKLNEYGLVSILEDAFTQSVTNSKDKEKLKVLMDLIAKQKEKDPYYGLKFEQKVIIRNLEKELRITDKTNTSFGFVEQVKEVVRRQNSEIDELKKSNSWGIPVGIAGISFTILFGLIGLIYPFINRNKV